MYNPAPVPTMLTMNAVIIPTRAPSHQPMAPPIVAPIQPISLLTQVPSELPAFHFLEEPLGLGVLVRLPFAQRRVELGGTIGLGRYHLGGILLRQGGQALVLAFRHQVSRLEGVTGV